MFEMEKGQEEADRLRFEAEGARRRVMSVFEKVKQEAEVRRTRRMFFCAAVRCLSTTDY